MCVTKTHLILEALGNTGDHILDVRGDGSNGGKVLASTEPEIDLDLLVVDLLDVKRHVLEVTCKGTLRAGHSGNTRLE
jgi:hypothetical protein